MASSKVYVGGLPWRCSADDLRQVCSKFGVVEDAFIVMDKTGAAPRSKGFGFVTFSDANDAATCLRSLNGSEYGGRVLKVGMAHKETGGGNGAAYGRQQRGYGAGAYGGGGYGRGNYGSNYNFSGDYSQLGAQSGGYGTSYDNFLQSDGYSGSYSGPSFSNGSYDQYAQDNVAYGSTNRGFGGNNQYGGYSSFGFGGAGY
ncbi:cold-inducible RNA-binding protein-like [Rhopilema esculentum]|uniref:cold-inducible RNA-binding protein-like n=1 Tax=Rhopilema esculentum TaxID=499914 RepID=UPI0031E38E88|eukprot:gene17228-8781_t